MNKIKIKILSSLFSLILMLKVTGCDENGGITIPSGSTELTISTKSDHSFMNPPANVVITEVKALIHQVQFEQESNQNNQTITFSPFVAYFNTNGSLRDMSTNYIIRDFYTKIKFQIHKPEENETPSDPEFKEGTLSDKRYSFIIKGTYNGISFIYKSKISSNVVLSFNPTTNFNLKQMNVTVNFNELGWFKNGTQDLDPANPQNAVIIDNNIKNSFKKVYLDNNKDGIPD